METVSLLTVQLKRQSLAEDGTNGNSAAQNEFQCDSGLGSSDGFLSTSPLPLLQRVEEDDVAVTGFSPPRAFSRPALSSLATTVHTTLPAVAFSGLSLPSLLPSSSHDLDNFNVRNEGEGEGHDFSTEECCGSLNARLSASIEPVVPLVSGKVKVAASRKRHLTTLSMVDSIEVTPSSDEEVSDLLSSSRPHLLLPPADSASAPRLTTKVRADKGSLSVTSSWGSEEEGEEFLRCVSPRKRHCSAADICLPPSHHQQPHQQASPSPDGGHARGDERPCLNFEKMIERARKYSVASTGGGDGKLVKVKATSGSSPLSSRASSSSGLFDPAVFAFQSISMMAFNAM